MTIERTRELLGDRVKNLNDKEVAEIIQQFSRLASVAVDLLPKAMKYDHNKLPTRKLRT